MSRDLGVALSRAHSEARSQRPECRVLALLLDNPWSCLTAVKDNTIVQVTYGGLSKHNCALSIVPKSINEASHF